MDPEVDPVTLTGWTQQLDRWRTAVEDQIILLQADQTEEEDPRRAEAIDTLEGTIDAIDEAIGALKALT